MTKESPLYDKAYKVLSHSLLFGTLSHNTLTDMLCECTEVYWKKVDTLDPDMGSKHLFVIITGRLKVTHIDAETGRSLALFLKGKGEIFDFFSLLDNKEHVVFPVAMDNMSVLRIPLKRAREWIIEYPNFNQSLLPYLGEKMRELEAFGTSLVFHDTTTRLAKLILRYTHPQSLEGYHSVHIINTLSHESLAELIGSVRSVVSTQIHKLKEENIITSKRGHMAVSNLNKLLQKIET